MVFHEVQLSIIITFYFGVENLEVHGVVLSLSLDILIFIIIKIYHFFSLYNYFHYLISSSPFNLSVCASILLHSLFCLCFFFAFFCLLGVFSQKTNSGFAPPFLSGSCDLVREEHHRLTCLVSLYIIPGHALFGYLIIFPSQLSLKNMVSTAIKHKLIITSNVRMGNSLEPLY